MLDTGRAAGYQASFGGTDNQVQRGLLDRPNRDGSRKQSIESEKERLSKTNANDIYEEDANRYIYSFGAYDVDTTKVRDRYDGQVREKRIYKNRFTDDAFNSVLSGLNDTQEEHGVLVTDKFNKSAVQQELDKLNKDEKYRPEYDMRGTPFLSMYDSLGDYTQRYVTVYPEDDLGGMGGTPEPTTELVWGSDNQRDMYKQELEEILADPNDRYASWWTLSKKEYKDGYHDLSTSLKKSGEDFKTNYIKSVNSTVSDELSTLNAYEEEDARRAASREEVFSKLFNQNRSTKRYL